MPVSSAVRIEVDDRRPKKHAAAFVGRLRLPLRLPRPRSVRAATVQ
jgi:hypothetical protein